MTPILVLSILVLYFAALILISVYTSKGATSDTFFTANRQSPWYLVAFGMIGSSLSGITFVSVPGSVGTSGFAYFQVVLGYLLGYWVIITVLMPMRSIAHNKPAHEPLRISTISPRARIRGRQRITSK